MMGNRRALACLVALATFMRLKFEPYGTSSHYFRSPSMPLHTSVLNFVQNSAFLCYSVIWRGTVAHPSRKTPSYGRTGETCVRIQQNNYMWQWTAWSQVIGGLGMEVGCVFDISPREIHHNIQYGNTVSRLPRIYVKDRIMDDFNNQTTLINIVVESRGRISKRRIGTKFREQTGTSISTSTLVRKLKDLKVAVKQRRYKPCLTKTHKWTRYFF